MHFHHALFGEILANLAKSVFAKRPDATHREVIRDAAVALYRSLDTPNQDQRSTPAVADTSGSAEMTPEEEGLFTPVHGGNRLPLGDQVSIGCDAYRGVVMEAAPPAPFEMPEPNLLLLELLIAAPDAPTQLGHVHQRAEGNVLRKR